LIGFNFFVYKLVPLLRCSPALRFYQTNCITNIAKKNQYITISVLISVFSCDTQNNVFSCYQRYPFYKNLPTINLGAYFNKLQKNTCYSYARYLLFIPGLILFEYLLLKIQILTCLIRLLLNVRYLQFLPSYT